MKGRFAISRGSRTQVEVVVAELEADGHVGRGECTPYSRYGESVEGVIEDVLRAGEELRETDERDRLGELLGPGAARNALDAAHWDLEARRTGVSVRARLGLGPPRDLPTFVTIGVASPAEMARAAQALSGQGGRLKLKGSGEGDLDRVAAVRAVAPGARIIVDANEAWSDTQLEHYLPEMRRYEVELVEQPLPADQDAVLEDFDSPIPLCADESCHDRSTLDRLVGRYHFVNLKLDKTGGLTEALAMLEVARERGLGVMVGCMLGTSLAMAAALPLAERADLIDLDAPLLLDRDRVPGLEYRSGWILGAAPGVWG